MSHQQDPFCSSGAICGGNYEVGQSPTNEESDCFLDSSVTPPNCWLQIYRSLGNGTSEMDDFQDILGVLMDVSGCATSSVQTNSSTPLKSEFAPEPCKEQSNAPEREPGERVLRRCRSDAREVSEELTRKQNDRLKRTRSAEVHKMSERRRRSRINNRLKVLQELIPNCNKLDRVSVLDHAINYLKGLKLQIEMMSAGQGRFIFQGAYISSGLQSTQVSQFSPFVLPIGPNCNWAMCYSTSLNHPTIPIPSATLHPSLLSGSLGLCQMPAGPGNNAVPQVAIPFSHPQQLSTSAML